MSRRAKKRSRGTGRRGAKGRGGAKRAGRVGTARRQAIVGLALLAIPAGLVVAVQRTAEGTRLAEQLDELRRETRLLEEALVDEVVRVDSLASRERIERAAGPLGLRPASEEEVVVVSATSAGTNVKAEGP